MNGATPKHRYPEMLARAFKLGSNQVLSVELRLGAMLHNLGASKRASTATARCLGWVVKLAVLGIALYVTFWLALFLFAAWAAVIVLSNGGLAHPVTPEDRRNAPSYVPENFNDTPDPRYP